MDLPTNSGAGIISALPQLVSLFTGSGKTTSNNSQTTTQAKNANPLATQAFTDIISSKGPDTSAAVTNAIDLLLRSGLPSIGSAERGSGIFNYSGTREAVNQLSSTAVAKAAEIDLNQQNQNTANKISAANALNESTGTVTTSQSGSGSQQTGAQVDPLMAALTIGGLVGVNKLLKGFGDESSNSGNLAPDFTPVVRQQDVGSILDMSLNNFGSDVASGLKSTVTDPVSGEMRTGGGTDFLDVISNVGLNTGISALFSGIGNAIFGGGSSGSSSSGGGSTFGTVICTRMHELGYLSNEEYAYDILFGMYTQGMYPDLFKWYHSWAVPFVTNWMHGKTIVSRLVIQVLRPIVKVWTIAMIARAFQLAQTPANIIGD